MLMRILVFLLMLSTVQAHPGREQTILILGDSISSAYGIDKEQGWVALLQQRLDNDYPGWTVINASVSGDTTRTGLNRLEPALDEHHPDILIVELGGNDGLRGLPFSEIRNSLTAIIELALEREIHVLLTGIQLPPNYGEAYNNYFNGIYRELAGKFAIPLVPAIMDKVGGNGLLMQEDGIHPTAEAQPQLLENVWDRLEPLLRGIDS